MKYIKHPYEFFLAQVLFAKKMSEVTGTNFPAALIEYTDLYLVFTGGEWTEADDRGEYSEMWLKFMDTHPEITDLKEFTSDMYEIYKNQTYAYIELEDSNKPKENEYRYGCFTIEYSEYNRSRNQVRLHFTPLRLGMLQKNKNLGKSDLSSENIQLREKEFKDMITFIKNSPDIFFGAEYLVSSTWLQNLPNYQRLFPPKYSLNENRVKKEDSFLGLWGQFEKWNFQGNITTLNEFQNNLKIAKAKEEVVDSFPNPVYKIRVPLEEMFKYYEIH